MRSSLKILSFSKYADHIDQQSFPTPTLFRSHDVVGAEVLAVVEFDARAQLEFPGGRIGEPPGDRETGDQLGIQAAPRSEEHTSELQSRFDLVCRLLLEKKKRYR